MTRIARAIIAFTLAAYAVTASTVAAPICLQTQYIRNTSVPNSRTILFHMTDGTTWRNTLRNSCPDLKWDGFTYVLRGPNEICENLLGIRTLYTGEACLLGPFTREPPAHG